MNDTRTLSLTEIHDLAVAALTANGCSNVQAQAIAATVTAAERDHCQAHGLYRIPFFIKALRQSGAVADAEPQVHELAPAVIQADGGLGFAPHALEVGCDALIERTRSQGIAALAVTNVFHISALWPEVERLADAGLVAFAFTGALSYVAPAGGSAPLYGTNPMAFAWPRGDQSPIVFDQASSTSARGNLELCRQAGEALPEGWALGPNGQHTTDPGTALAGAQLPFGGHKGAALALMVELLAGGLIGDLFSFEASEHDTNGVGAPRGGEFLIAIDPARCLTSGDQAAQQAHVEQLVTRILSQDDTRLPGQRRFEARAHSRTHGVEIPGAALDQIQAFIDGTA